MALLREGPPMGWLRQTLNSSIGGKFIVAVTGLALVGFILAHLAGNLLIYVGPEALAAYAEGLRKYPAVLWGMRLGLIAATLLHIWFALKLNLQSRMARPVPYSKKHYVAATFESRSMVLTGLLLLFYALFLSHYVQGRWAF